MDRETGAAFNQAVKESKQLKSKPSDDDLLALYALFKQAKQNPPFESATKPGTFDFKGKAKFNAWKKIEEAGVTPEEAETKYVEKIEEMKEKYGFDANKEPEVVGSS